MNFINLVAVANIRRQCPTAQSPEKLPKHCDPNGQGSFVAAMQDLFVPKFEDLTEAEKTGLDEPKWEKKRHRMWIDLYKPEFMPDMFAVDMEARTITLFEIEDDNPLTDAKLQKIIYWWHNIDDEGEYKVRLIVTDRYGLNHRELLLETLYSEVLLPFEANSANEQRRPAETKRPAP